MKKILTLGLLGACCFNGGMLEGVEKTAISVQNIEKTDVRMKGEVLCKRSGVDHGYIWQLVPLEKLSTLNGEFKVKIKGADCQFTGSVLDIIADMKASLRLYISSESLDDDNIEKAKRGLEKKTISKLYIRSDNLGIVPNLTMAGLQKLKETLIENIEITIECPWLKDKLGQEVFGIINEVYGDSETTLDVTFEGWGDDISLKQFRSIQEDVSQIEFSQDVYGSLRRTIEFLKTRTDFSPTDVSFDDSCLSDDNIKYINEFLWAIPYIQSLDFQSECCTDDGFEQLVMNIIGSRCKWDFLTMRFKRVTPSKFHDGLLRIARSRWEDSSDLFNMRNYVWGFSSVSVSDLRESETVTEICVYDNSKLASDVMEEAKDKQDLESVSFFGDSINDDNVQKLRELLENNESIYELSILRDESGKGARLTEAGLEVLKTAVNRHTNLRFFNFDCPDVINADAFERCYSSAKRACLNRRKVRYKVGDSETYARLAEFIKENRPIDCISFDYDSELLSVVLRILPDKNVRKLQLRGTSVDDNSIAQLKVCLCRGCTLEEISISPFGSSIEDSLCSSDLCLTRAGFDDLEAAVMAGKHLKKFSFESDELNDAETLARCEKMKQVCFERRRIAVRRVGCDKWVSMPLKKLRTEQGVEAIMVKDDSDLTVCMLNMIQQRKGIKYLKFLGESIKKSSAVALREYLKVNNSIKNITIDKRRTSARFLGDDMLKEVMAGIIASPSLTSYTLIPKRDLGFVNYGEYYAEMDAACARRAAMQRDAVAGASIDQPESDK